MHAPSSLKGVRLGFRVWGVWGFGGFGGVWGGLGVWGFWGVLGGLGVWGFGPRAPAHQALSRGQESRPWTLDTMLPSIPT